MLNTRRVIAVTTVLVILSFLVLSFPNMGSAETGIVSRSVANLRSGPGTGYKITGKALEGTKLAIIGVIGNWYRVRLDNSKICWIYKSLVKLVKKESIGSEVASRTKNLPAALVVDRSLVNLRSGPGADYPLMGRVSGGTRLTAIGRCGDWFRVRLENGKVCWVAGWLVKAVPVENVASTVVLKSEEGPVTAAPQPPLKDEPVTPAGSMQPMPVSVSRSPDNGELISVSTEESEGGTGFLFAFVCPVETVVQKLGDPLRLVVDISGLPKGRLPDLQNLGSRLISSVQAGWLQEDPTVARVVFELRTVKGDVYWEAVPSSDRQALRLNLRSGAPYAVTGKVVVLDPGHGGHETGALGPTGLEEKDFNLSVAHIAAQWLSGRGAQVWLTREKDEYVDLYARTAKANSLGASVFVSIHANANEQASQKGTSTYWYAPAGDPVLGPQRQERELLAQCLQKELVKNLGRKDLGLYTANFVVLRTAAMPAALIEAAFVSNPEEETLLRTEWFRQATARAVVEGLEAYFGQVR